MEYYSAIERKACESVLMRLMNLEPIIQSEVGQKENNKYRNQTRIYMESRKMVLKNLFTGQQWRNRHRKYGHGEREEKVRRMERVTRMLTIPYVK